MPSVKKNRSMVLLFLHRTPFPQYASILFSKKLFPTTRVKIYVTTNIPAFHRTHSSKPGLWAMGYGCEIINKCIHQMAAAARQTKYSKTVKVHGLSKTHTTRVRPSWLWSSLTACTLMWSAFTTPIVWSQALTWSQRPCQQTCKSPCDGGGFAYRLWPMLARHHLYTLHVSWHGTCSLHLRWI